MPLNTPQNSQEVENRSKVDIQNQLPESNPFLKNSWIAALISANSNRVFDFYQNLEEAVKQTFFDTSTDEFLERQASWFGVTKLQATQSTGSLVVTGTATTIIPAATEYKTSDGEAFTTDSLATITTNVIVISTLTNAGGTATAQTADNHELASGMTVLIADATEPEYNGSVLITVVDDDTFTYSISGSPTSPAGGFPTVSSDSAFIPITSVEFEEDTNLDGSTTLTITASIAGADDDATIDINGTTGGLDVEGQESFRKRFIERTGEPVAHFNVQEITVSARKIPGVTRVFVFEITPAVGDVTIYFMRDNDTDPIPNATDVTNVKNEILKLKPANTADSSVIVSAPTAVSVDFTISALSPDTQTMRESIRKNLEFFFTTETEVGVNIIREAYNSVVFSTVDEITGERISTFNVSTPAADVTINTGEIGIMGSLSI